MSDEQAPRATLRSRLTAFSDFTSGINAIIASVAGVVALLVTVGIVTIGNSSSSARSSAVSSNRPGAPLSSSPTVPSSSVDSSPSPVAAVVADVYDQPATDGILAVRNQGFVHLRSVSACSSTVANGNIRDVIVDDNAPSGSAVTVVGSTGVGGGELPFSTPLLFEVSTGLSCYSIHRYFVPSLVVSTP